MPIADRVELTSARPPGDVVARLVAAAPPTNGFGWYFGSGTGLMSRRRDDGLLVAVRHPFAGRTGPVAAVAVSPDGAGSAVRATVRPEWYTAVALVWAVVLLVVGPLRSDNAFGLPNAVACVVAFALLYRMDRRDRARLRTVLGEAVS